MKLNFIKEIYENPRRRRIAIGSLLAALVFAFIFFSDHGLVKRLRLDMRQSELEQRIAIEKSKRDSLKAEIEKLKNDKYEIEKIAREKYGMVKPGEKVYYIDIEED
jgi:cell division protein FtsB